MVVYRNEVSHQWEKYHLLEQWRAGTVTRDEVCDADFLLVTAARYHGRSAGRDCPVCGSEQLREVEWIHGDSLGRMAGTARSVAEIERIAASGQVLTVHTVEVCPVCRWNHLLRAVTASAT
ncbi:DUF5318 family protein [Corynebacterium halotolerans]|uniref:DUF5318 family protein n=1 Tax=Corynebacterium halotolerans TaxID=225326 RepID=UPI003CF1275D